MEEDYDSFLNTLQKRGSKPHSISHCYGSRDAWKWVRKNKWKELGGKPCDQSLYSNVVSHVNQLLAELLLEGYEIPFPHGMGSLRLSSMDARISVEDGKVVTNCCTDWKRTLQCWFEDREMREAHKTLKWVQKKLYFVRYYKKQAVFRNRRFYSFRPNRSLVKALGRNSARSRLNAESV